MSLRSPHGRERRKKRIRKKIVGTSQRPRLTVYRSANHLYAQIIDDSKGATLVSASTLEKGEARGGNKTRAEAVGKKLGEKAKAAKIESVVFDRNGYLYHGRVKSFADAVREAGVKF